MIILCSATAVVVSIPLIRRYDDRRNDLQEQAIYQDQLSEVDRDQKAGTIDAPEAEAARIEIHRRLAEAKSAIQHAQPLSAGWKMLALVSTAGLVILGGVNLYGVMGAPDIPSVSNVQTPASVAAQTPVTEPATVKAAQDPNADAGTGQVDSIIAKLQARLQTNPKDAEGWRMLGWAQFNTQHYAASADAYAKALEIDPANIDYKSAYAESLVQSAEGIVTPKAQGLIAEVLAKDPKEFRARFYDALAHEQAGDQNGALDRWISLLADAPADANWRDDVKQRVANLGKTLGRDVSAAPAPTQTAIPPSASAPQITDEQKSAIQSLPADDQQAMIKGMVAKLADKLASNPNDPDGWIRLIRSYQVLNDQEAAKDALSKATTALANDATNKEKVIAAANELGVK